MLVMEAITIKGKRTKRQRASHHQALLASSSGETGGGASPSSSSSEETAGDVRFAGGGATEEEEDMANCLILLARGRESKLVQNDVVLYECKTCDRVFPSFQALGGHRAGHKKLKANGNNSTVVGDAVKAEKTTPFCFVDGTGTALSLRVSPGRGILGINHPKNNNNNNSKVHECSVCGAEFTSGQALGGHMRRHRTTTSFTNQTTTTTTTTTATTFSSSSPDRLQDYSKKSRNVLELDLNLPAQDVVEDNRSGRETTNFPFTASEKEQVIVFSASSLVDCHY